MKLDRENQEKDLFNSIKSQSDPEGLTLSHVQEQREHVAVQEVGH